MRMCPLGEGTLHVPASTSFGHTPVRCVHSPHLTSALLCEDGVSTLLTQQVLFHVKMMSFVHKTIFDCVRLHNNDSKCCEAGTFSLKCQHVKQKNKQFCTHGIITIGNECCAQPLILSDLPATHPDANKHNSFDSAPIHDWQFACDCHNSTTQNVKLFQQQSHEHLVDQLRSLPENHSTLLIDTVVKNAADVNAVRAQTERLLWQTHQMPSQNLSDGCFTTIMPAD